MTSGTDAAMAALRTVLGEGRDLEWFQMAARAALVFVATWLLLRLAGRRTFAQKTAFDLCIMLLLGAVLSRAVVGASPVLGTLAAAAVLVGLHRGVSMLSVAWPAFDRVVGGRAIAVVKNGHEDARARKRAMLTDEDLDANARGALHAPRWDGHWDVVLERDGQISFVKPQTPQSRQAATPQHAARDQHAHAEGPSS